MSDIMHGWQPISTAPKDGTLFMGRVGRTVATFRYVWRTEIVGTVVKGFWPFRSRENIVIRHAGLYLSMVLDRRGGFLSNRGQFPMAVTHWKPLPPFPEDD